MLIFLLTLFTALRPAPPTATLTVTIQNVSAKGGPVRVALLNNCGKFPDCPPTQGQKLESGKTSATFDVPPGSYAVAVYQDVNNNGKLDTRLFGIPKEPYGFSNNFRPKFSAPKFSDCRVTVPESGKAITIKLID